MQRRRGQGGAAAIVKVVRKEGYCSLTIVHIEAPNIETLRYAAQGRPNLSVHDGR